MNSIIHDGEACWLCGRNGSSDPLDWHHIYGGAHRNKSERYGLKARLCHHDCHIFGLNAVHSHSGNNLALKQEAQQRAMDYYGWTVSDFIELFGKNYL